MTIPGAESRERFRRVHATPVGPSVGELPLLLRVYCWEILVRLRMAGVEYAGYEQYLLFEDARPVVFSPREYTHRL